MVTSFDDPFYYNKDIQYHIILLRFTSKSPFSFGYVWVVQSQTFHCTMYVTQHTVFIMKKFPTHANCTRYMHSSSFQGNILSVCARSILFFFFFPFFIPIRLYDNDCSIKQSYSTIEGGEQKNEIYH